MYYFTLKQRRKILWCSLFQRNHQKWWKMLSRLNWQTSQGTHPFTYKKKVFHLKAFHLPRNQTAVNRKEQENAAWIWEEKILPHVAGIVRWGPLFVLSSPWEYCLVLASADTELVILCFALTNVQSARAKTALLPLEAAQVVTQSPGSDSPSGSLGAWNDRTKSGSDREKRPTQHRWAPPSPSGGKGFGARPLLQSRPRSLCPPPPGLYPKGLAASESGGAVQSRVVCSCPPRT